MMLQHQWRNDLAKRAEEVWLYQEDLRANLPYGFSFLGHSIEVHPRISKKGEVGDVKLEVYKVTHTGQLMEVCHVRV